jgi:hypothetical protein
MIKIQAIELWLVIFEGSHDNEYEDSSSSVTLFSLVDIGRRFGGTYCVRYHNDMSVSIYQTAQCCIPEDCVCLHLLFWSGVKYGVSLKALTMYKHTVTIAGCYRTRLPKQCDHFWSFVRSHLSSNHSWSIYRSALSITSRDIWYRSRRTWREIVVKFVY